MSRPRAVRPRPQRMPRLRPILLATVCLAALPGCTALNSFVPAEAPEPARTITRQDLPPPPAQDGPIALAPGGASERVTGPAEVVLGTGQFVNPQAPRATGAGAVPVGDDVTLDFADVAIRDVLRSVLGDLLGVSYTVDPEVQGSLTLLTGSPIPRSALIDVLTDVLQLNGVALVLRNDIYLAVPIANATRQAPLGGVGGFVTRIATARYVAAGELQAAVAPVVPASTTLTADAGRNLLIVSGPEQDVNRVLENVAVFDADFMRGMSFALLPLQYGRAREVAQDVGRMLASIGPSATEIVKVFPVDRINAVMVTSKQPAYIQRVRDWVDRFDRGDGQSEPQMYVYRVQNGRASDLAGVLRRALGLEQPGGARATDPAGPGTTATPAWDGIDAAPGIGLGGMGGGTAGGMAGSDVSPVASDGAAQPQVPPDPLAGVGILAGMADGAAAGPQAFRNLRISEDNANNALVIVATPQDYAQIEAALQKLDIPPLQVLIEATVAEVTLNDRLALGLQYAFKTGNFAAVFAPNVAPAAAATGAGAGNLPGFPGFGFASGGNLLYSSNDSAVLLQALSQITTVRILSSPNLMVLNNGTARLQVGDQVPVATQTSTSTITPNAPTVSNIEYRDTGVILNVVPRVNASGLVVMDIVEEVSAPFNTTSSTISSPSIQQRRVTSSVAVHDGQTIALAGLIEDRTEQGSSGLPWLKDIPVLGLLFGTQNEMARRTELLVLITPRVIRSRDEGEAVTRELREKLRMTVPALMETRS